MTMGDLTRHFSVHEFTKQPISSPDMPAGVRARLPAIAGLLQAIRDEIGGARIVVTDYWRSREENKNTHGAAANSQHLDGTAVDLKVLDGITPFAAYNAIKEGRRAGRIPPIGEVIFYPFTDGHIHITLPTRGDRDQFLVKLLAEEGGGYAPISDALASRFPGYPRVGWGGAHDRA